MLPFSSNTIFFKKITWLSKLVKGTLEHDVDNKLKFTLLITPMFILNLNFSLGYEIFYFILKTFVLNIIYFEVFDYKSIPFIVRIQLYVHTWCARKWSGWLDWKYFSTWALIDSGKVCGTWRTRTFNEAKPQLQPMVLSFNNRSYHAMCNHNTSQNCLTFVPFN